MIDDVVVASRAAAGGRRARMQMQSQPHTDTRSGSCVLEPVLEGKAQYMYGKYRGTARYHSIVPTTTLVDDLRPAE